MKSLSVLLSLVLLWACGDSTEPQGAVGFWELRSVNGNALPVTIYNAVGVDQCDVIVRHGQYELNVDGTFTGVTKYGVESGGRGYCYAEYVESGTYTVGRESVTFTDGGYVHIMTLDSRALSHTRNSDRYVYHK
jgi:hypothetical protein